MPELPPSRTRRSQPRKPPSGVQGRTFALVRELRLLIETTRTLASAGEPKAVLRVIFDKAKTFVRCEAWSLFLIDPSTHELVFEMVGGPKARRLKGLRVKFGQGIVGWVAQHGKPAVVNETRKDRRFHPAIDRVTRFVTRSVLCVPIFSRKRPAAVLEMVNKVGKPFDRQDLHLLIHLAEQASIALERLSLQEQAASLGVTDELTQLYNARYLDQALDREARRCRRYGSIMALIFLDLDEFKRINDQYGHLMGSQCLTELAQIMMKSVRDVDILARYGGDEFVVILPETTVATARSVAERLHEAITSHIFLSDEGIKARLTASIGIAGFPDHAQSKEGLLRKADEAMYRAKSEGPDKIHVAE
jgi:diguanylate cyclase (GGDEF)-like protein